MSNMMVPENHLLTSHYFKKTVHTSLKSFPSFVTDEQHLTPKIEPCSTSIHDEDAFFFDPAHLKNWDMPDALRVKLPSELIIAVTNFQHAGATILTSFDRVARLKREVQSLDNETTLREAECSMFNPSDFDERFIANKASSPTTNNASLTLSHVTGTTYPITPPITATPFTSVPATPSLSPASGPSRSPSPRRKFSVPLAPRAAYYVAELSCLRTEGLPRLRHAAMRVDSAWYEARRLARQRAGVGSPFSSPPLGGAAGGAATAANDGADGAPPEFGTEFEDWWCNVRELATVLCKRCLEMTRGEDLKGLGDWAV